MKAMRNPFPGATRIFQDTDGTVYVMVYPSCIQGIWNWGVNPGLLVRLWRYSAKKIFIDLVPPGERRELPYIPSVIPRGELMKRLSQNGEFNEQKGFYRLFVEETTL